MKNQLFRVAIPVVLGTFLEAAPTARGQAYMVREFPGSVGVDHVGGQSVSSGGDVDGDGIHDLIVGAPFASPPAGGTAAGRAKVFSGATGAVLLVLEGSESFGQFGQSVAGAGDLNGDGSGDILVGAPGARSGAGQAIVFSGAGGSVLLSIDGTTPNGGLGRSVAGVGDLNGDGTPDLLVAAPGSLSIPAGVKVFSGADGSVLLAWTGSVTPDLFGWSVAAAGDVNSDGVTDLLVGAPAARPGGMYGAGQAKVFSGTNGSTLLTFEGSYPNHQLGFSVAGAGDVNGDGIPDLIVGALTYPAGEVRVFSGATGALLFAVAGAAAGDSFGRAVAGVGDVNGDGRGDLLVGGPYANLGGPGTAGLAKVLSGSNGAILHSFGGHDALGWGVAGIGDLNGDGVPDLLVGAPGANLGAGRVLVFSGRSGATLFSFDGIPSGDAFGSSVARTGDLDGDGVPDVLVGAPQGAPGGLHGAGQAKAVSGASGATVFSFAGASAGEAFGSSVAAAGDLDGDGFPDLVIGAPRASPGGLQGAGRAVAFSGSSGSVLLHLQGSTADEFFGASVAGVGDLDGDGRADLVVGSPGPDAGASPGRARVFSGANGTLLFDFQGVGPADQLGRSVAGPGDVNGDGVPDVLIGAPGAASTAGKAIVFSGANGAALLAFTGGFTPPFAIGHRLGFSVAGAGDVNGDGRADLVVGAPFANPGGVGAAGQARVYSGATGGILLTLDGTVASGHLGTAVAGAGDVNGDGTPDLLVSDSPLGGAGGVRLFSGAGGAPMLAIQSLEPGEEFGFSLAGAGDVDGDGLDDLLVGARGADPGGLVNAGKVQILSLTGIPAGSSLFGAGCPGSGGFTPRISTAGGAPAPGNFGFSVFLTRALGGKPTHLKLGLSNTSWIGIPLPLDLGFVGMPGCALLVSVDFVFPTATSGSGPGTGVASLALPIPADPFLSGNRVYFQWYVADPGPFYLPGALSPGLDLLIP